METFRNYKCKSCGYNSSQEFKKCPKCKNENKKIAIGFEDKISMIEILKKDINLLWDSSSLTLFGVLISIFLCLLFGLMTVFFLDFLCSFFLSSLIILILIVCIKIKKTKRWIITLMRRILK